MEWKEKGKGKGGEETHTISHNTHTACGGGIAGMGGGGRKSISLPAFIEMHFHLQSVELSLCVGQCIRNR